MNVDDIEDVIGDVRGYAGDLRGRAGDFLEDAGGDIIRELWRLLDEVQEAGFSLNPLELGHNIAVIGRMIQRAWEIAAERPPGDPAGIESAAAAWRQVKTWAVAGDDELDAARVHDVWTGSAALKCGATFRRLGTRFQDAGTLAGTAATALDDYGEEIVRAHTRHDEGGDYLRAAGARLGLCPPWEIPDMIRDVIWNLCDGVRAFIDSYEIAGAAARACAQVLRRVAYEMPFPEGSVDGMSVLELINVSSADPGMPPLYSDVARRAQELYDQLGEGAREMVDQMLADAPSAQHRAWILAALASGASLETLANFANQIEGLSESELRAALDPTSVNLQQQSDTTCGSASLVVARMLDDPVYALRILTGYDAVTGEMVPSPSYDDLPPYHRAPEVESAEHLAMRQRFHEAELDAKARTNDGSDGNGGWSLPWVDALGTSPWGAAEELNGAAGGDGYSVSLIDSDSAADRQQAYDALERAGMEGQPSVVYVGDATTPRHVVLVVGVEDGSLVFYEPGNGGRVVVTEEEFVSGGFNLGGWGTPWAVVAS